MVAEVKTGWTRQPESYRMMIQGFIELEVRHPDSRSEKWQGFVNGALSRHTEEFDTAREAQDAVWVLGQETIRGCLVRVDE